MASAAVSSSFKVSEILKSGIRNAVIFALLWGAWAWWINSGHGAGLAWKAARTQVAFTVVNAFVYSVVMEFLFSRIGQPLLRGFVTFFVPNVAVTVLLTWLHVVRGTPNVFETVLPPLLVVGAISMLYILVLGPRRLRAGELPKENAS